MQEIVVVVDGGAGNGPTLTEGCRLADGDGRKLTVVMIHQGLGEWANWALFSAGIDPDRLRTETEMEERFAIREALDAAGVNSGYRLEVVRRRCPEDRLERLLGGSKTVILPPRLSRALRRIRGVAERIGPESVLIAAVASPVPAI